MCVRMQPILCSGVLESLHPPFGLAVCGAEVHAPDSSEAADHVH